MVMKKTLLTTLTASIFLITIIGLLTPITMQVFGADNTQEYFNLSVTINNSAPSIDGVADASATPTEGSTTTVSILFNVSDSNGYEDVDPSQSYANVTLNGVTRESSSCQNYAPATSGNIQGVNCTITINYYDEPGTWNISVTAQDSNPTTASSNNAATLTYSTLYAFTLEKNSVSFSGEPGDTDVNASNDPQIINNTGNGNFANINLTGYELSNGVDTIGAGNFTVNATADAKGASVGSNQQITSATLNRNNTQNLYIWADIPSGISDGTYTTNTTTQWMVEAYN